jgi:glutamate synthase (NADPH/NADH) small chain
MSVPEGSEKVIDRKARMKLPYVEVEARPPEVRTRDFEPTFMAMTPEEAMQAAERCIHCADPAPCVEACPVHNDIPSAMWLCGRVCPHEALCQGACVRDKRGEPVITGALEVFVTSYQRENAPTKIPVGKPIGKKVAIVGSGPSGLACAEQLVPKGYSVSIFEAAPAPGGLLLYGIPNFKLAKSVVEAVVNDLKEAGVEFILNTRIGKDKTIESLFNDGYEAVYISVGTGIDATMEVPGAELPGVYLATEFLIRANVDPDQLPEDKRGKLEIGKKIAVIGGGDTASDCLRSALRLGADEVTCLYRRTEAEMPGGKKDRELAKEEGAVYRFLTQPSRFPPTQSCLLWATGRILPSAKQHPTLKPTTGVLLLPTRRPGKLQEKVYTQGGMQ